MVICFDANFALYFKRVNQKVKAIFKLRGNLDREELAHCALLALPVEEFSHVQYSALPSVEWQQQGRKHWTLLCKIAPSKNNVAQYGIFGQKERNLWKFTAVCWLSMDRAPQVNGSFMSGWKGLNRVERVLLMKVILIGHQHRAHKTTSAAEKFLRRNTETS